MNRIERRSLFVLACSLVLVGMHEAAFAQAASGPNVILIITDDQGYGDLSSHGNPTLRTPHLDRLAAQSVELTNFYVNPVCSPTRASLMTGRYSYRSGVWETYLGGEVMRSDEVTLAELLQERGYRTAIIGKWHLGEVYPWVPKEEGFQHGLYFRHGNIPFYFDAVLESDLQPIQTRGYITDVLTDAAIQFLEKRSNQPFFLYLAYNAPHYPLQLPEKYLQPFRKEGVSETIAKVYGMIACLDDSVGRLLSKLEKIKLAQNTIVLFMSDNGPQDPRYNAGLRGLKGGVYEGGIRVPFFARWPGKFSAGRKIAEPAAVIDLMPTILDFCGMSQPQGLDLDGWSLKPLLQGEIAALPDRFLFLHWQRQMQPRPYPNGAVRNRRYKLVNGSELYDLLSDPGEQKNVAEQNPELVSDLRRRYDDWWTDVTRERGFVVPPTPVGYAEENPARLLAMHAQRHGQIQFSYGRLLNDALTGWTRVEDFVSWNIDVIRGGKYEVNLIYRCSTADAGARVRVEVDASQAEFVVAPGGSAQEWAVLNLGPVEVHPGRNQLSLRAVSKAGSVILELNRVELKRLD